MGMQIDHVECLSGELEISDKGRRWLEKDNNGAPECGPGVTADGYVDMDWSGEGSARADKALARFFSFTTGTAEFVFYWEGMGCEGIRVVDGKMTKHEVEMRLGKEVK